MNEDCIIDQNITKSSDYFLFNTSGNWDICYSGLINNKLENEIKKDGIIVYEKSKN